MLFPYVQDRSVEAQVLLLHALWGKKIESVVKSHQQFTRQHVYDQHHVIAFSTKKNTKYEPLQAVPQMLLNRNASS